uniref:Autophagy-related protein 13 n=1 Tax=Talaromyces marneffei PM1 TaxID=1077442 RepID=A0A093VB38_TALMA
MAPPRQRPPASSVAGVGDDSRSEASSTATGGPTSRGVPGPKPRKSGATSTSGVATTGTLASAKELKVAAATGAAAAATNAAAASALSQIGVEYGMDGLRDDLPGVRPLP